MGKKLLRKKKSRLNGKNRGDGKLFWRKKSISSGNETNRTTLGIFTGQWIGYSQEELEYFAEYLVRRKNMLLERKHTLEAQSWAQCHEDELCQIMKADYPNEGIAALALEKQYGLDEQQARMIFDLRFRFMFGTARDLVERDNMVIGRMLEIFLKDEGGAEG